MLTDDLRLIYDEWGLVSAQSGRPKYRLRQMESVRDKLLCLIIKLEFQKERTGVRLTTVSERKITNDFFLDAVSQMESSKSTSSPGGTELSDSTVPKRWNCSSNYRDKQHTKHC